MNDFKKNAKLKSLEYLFDYTKFHIGVYLTMTAAYITVTTADFGDGPLFQLRPVWVWVAILFFLLAGAAGGTIVSSITQSDSLSSKQFLAEKIGPIGTKMFSALTWTRIEHLSFWAGILAAIASIKQIGGA